MTKREVPDLPGFMRFWAAWPGNTAGGYARKGGKAECMKLWRKGLEPHTEEILRHIGYMKTTRQWRETFGAYIPAPAVYLRQQRWDGADIPAPGAQMPQEESRREREARERVERIAPGAAARRPAQQQQWEVIDDASVPRIGG